jgi:D-3-phosphoglycerate dehydrogenase
VEFSFKKGGYEVITTKVAQEQVANFVNENNKRSFS